MKLAVFISRVLNIIQKVLYLYTRYYFLNNNSRITYDTNIIYKSGTEKSSKSYNSNKIIIEFKLDDSQKLNESFISKNLLFSNYISIEDRLFGNPEKFSKYVDSCGKSKLNK